MPAQTIRLGPVEVRVTVAACKCSGDRRHNFVYDFYEENINISVYSATGRPLDPWMVAISEGEARGQCFRVSDRYPIAILDRAVAPPPLPPRRRATRG